jgi:hypothetical protein
MVVNDEGREVRKVDGGEGLGLGSEGSIEGGFWDVVVFREIEGGEDGSVDSAMALASSCSFCLILPIPRLS